ncbi:hypothetical protein VPH35_052933 [Triticum aestivum]
MVEADRIASRDKELGTLLVSLETRSVVSSRSVRWWIGSWPPPPSSDHQQQLPLHGLTFSIKEMNCDPVRSFNIASRVTGFRTPDWARTHAPVSATVVRARRRRHGRGQEHTLETYHSAAIVTASFADFTLGTNIGGSVRVPAAYCSILGTDIGGSVRVPAAYCSIFGLRPSHGLVSTESVVPMEKMFDTIASDCVFAYRRFARDLATLSRVTDVVLPPIPADAFDGQLRRPSRVIIPADCFKILGSVEEPTYKILNASLAKVFGMVNNGNIVYFVSSNIPSISNFTTDLSVVEASLSCVPSLSVISCAMCVPQRSEIKANHTEWVNMVKPNLGPGIRRVQEAIASEDESAMDDLHAVRTDFNTTRKNTTSNAGILAIPTVPGAPAKLGMDAALLENFRARAFSLLSIAGLSGFCQASIPLGTRCGVPVSVSLLPRHGADRSMLLLR